MATQNRWYIVPPGRGPATEAAPVLRGAAEEIREFFQSQTVGVLAVLQVVSERFSGRGHRALTMVVQEWYHTSQDCERVVPMLASGSRAAPESLPPVPLELWRRASQEDFFAHCSVRDTLSLLHTGAHAAIQMLICLFGICESPAEEESLSRLLLDSERHLKAIESLRAEYERDRFYLSSGTTPQ